jgi:hypothetical protein
MAGPRIRTLKPEILDDEKVAPLSDTAFRLFTSLVILADDHGNARADVRWLQGQIWWAHGESPNVLLALVELCRGSLIDVYAVRGGTYVHLRGWEKHQRIDNAGKNRVPLPKDPDAQAIEVTMECFAETRGEPPRLAAGSRPGPGPGREGEGIEEAAATPPPKLNPPTRKHRLPPDWQPRDEERKRAQELGLDCDAEAAHFRDHHTAKGEPGLDWHAAFRNWLRNAVKFARQNRQGSLAVGKSARVEPKAPSDYPEGDQPV